MHSCVLYAEKCHKLWLFSGWKKTKITISNICNKEVYYDIVNSCSENSFNKYYFYN